MNWFEHVFWISIRLEAPSEAIIGKRHRLVDPIFAFLTPKLEIIDDEVGIQFVYTALYNGGICEDESLCKQLGYDVLIFYFTSMSDRYNG